MFRLKKLISLLADPIPGIEDSILEAKYRYSVGGGQDHGGLFFCGRYHRFSVPSKPMHCDSEILKEIGEEPQFLPADQSVEAFYKGLFKFGKISPDDYDHVAFDIAVQMMRRHFSRLRGRSIVPLSTVLEDMKRDTSPGPALKHLYQSKGEAVDDARFWEMYRIFHLSMQKPGGSVSYWGACSKVELRSKDKVIEGKTRVLCQGPFSFIFFQ